jgi:hypothetical protein
MSRAHTRYVVIASLALVVASLPASAQAQRGRAGAGAPAATPKQQAPIDLTGYWVSVVTEDWRYRMVTPPKGDHPGIPLNPEGNRIANSWDPAKDEAAGDQCKAYGAWRRDARARTSSRHWDGDDVMKLETEAGTQTRLFRFGAPGAAASAERSWQGTSAAQWEMAGGGRGRGRGAPQGGTLKVVTTRLRAGYTQKNGVPYSENAVLTEYFTRTTEPNGDSWLIVTPRPRGSSVLHDALRSQHALQEAARHSGARVDARGLFRAIAHLAVRSVRFSGLMSPKRTYRRRSERIYE